MKIMIVVTHLLGTGHLSRALTLGHSFAQAGHDVRVVSGGMPAPQLGSAGVRLIQLPPVRSDGVDFTRLLGPDDQIASPDHLAQRSACLTGEVMSDPPDALITELFPFGRRILRDEFKALLSAARSVPRTPKILCSIRDILAPPSKASKASKAAFAEDVVAEFYDAVLVHSDAATTPLENSWPVSDILRPYLRYTGFVAPPLTARWPRYHRPGRDHRQRWRGLCWARSFRRCDQSGQPVKCRPMAHSGRWPKYTVRHSRARGGRAIACPYRSRPSRFSHLADARQSLCFNVRLQHCAGCVANRRSRRIHPL